VTTELLTNSNTPPRVAEPPPPPMSQVIEATEGRLGIDWAEIWNYRELLYFLTWRDIKIRYKQTVLGAAWAVFQPVMTMIVFSIFFGRLARLGEQTGGVPYPIYVYAGLLPWTFFANAVGFSTNSLVASSNLITKVYFPRLVVPLATVAAGLVDLMISLGVLLGLMVYYGTPVSWELALVPLFLAGTVLTAAGVGTLTAALTVAYRDVRYITPFLLQLWMFVTPVIYPPSLVPRQWHWLLSLNPMAGLIDGFRAAFLARTLDWSHIGISLAVSAVVFWTAAIYFRGVERRFADII